MSGSGSNKECFNNARMVSKWFSPGWWEEEIYHWGQEPLPFFNHTVSLLRIIQDCFVLLMIRIIAPDRINLVVALVLRFPSICMPLSLYIDIRSTKAFIINNNSLQRSWRQHKLEVNLNQNVPACLWKLLWLQRLVLKSLNSLNPWQKL